MYPLNNPPTTISNKIIGSDFIFNKVTKIKISTTPAIKPRVVETVHFGTEKVNCVSIK